MPEHRINDLQPEKDLQLDGITIPSNTAPPHKTCANCPATFPVLNPRKRFCSRICKEQHHTLKPMHRGQKAPGWLTMSEIKSLMAAITRPRDRAIFSIAYHRGLRASEVGMLQMRDYTPPTINERTGRLYCRRLKDSDSKIYALTKSEQKEMRVWLRVRGPRDGRIFESSRHRGISRKMLDVLMKRYGKAAGIPPELRHFHALKHSCGVHLLLGPDGPNSALGVDQVKDWLGHRNIQNTMIYLKVANIRLDEAAKKLVNW